MSRTDARHAHRRPQSRGNGHGPHSDHRDERHVLGGDRREVRLHQAANEPCGTGWPTKRPSFPYTGGRTRQRQRCALAVSRPHERSSQLV
jgi:hypothetical protein